MIIMVPRVWGGTLILQIPLVSPLPTETVIAVFRDGVASAQFRDGSQEALFRDGETPASFR